MIMDRSFVPLTRKTIAAVLLLVLASIFTVPALACRECHAQPSRAAEMVRTSGHGHCSHSARMGETRPGSADLCKPATSGCTSAAQSYLPEAPRPSTVDAAI